MTRYLLFDHTADIGIEIFGRTKKELFAHAAWALTDVMLEGKEEIEVRRKRKKLTVEGADTADLLVNFLRELLYLFNGKARVIQNCSMMKCANRKLEAELTIEPYDKRKHTVKVEIKAVTYHGLCVEKEKTGWKARVIFDV